MNVCNQFASHHTVAYSSKLWILYNRSESILTGCVIKFWQDTLELYQYNYARNIIMLVTKDADFYCAFYINLIV